MQHVLLQSSHIGIDFSSSEGSTRMIGLEGWSASTENIGKTSLMRPTHTAWAKVPCLPVAWAWIPAATERRGLWLGLRSRCCTGRLPLEHGLRVIVRELKLHPLLVQVLLFDGLAADSI